MALIWPDSVQIRHIDCQVGPDQAVCLQSGRSYCLVISYNTLPTLPSHYQIWPTLAILNLMLPQTARSGTNTFDDDCFFHSRGVRLHSTWTRYFEIEFTGLGYTPKVFKVFVIELNSTGQNASQCDSLPMDRKWRRGIGSKIWMENPDGLFVFDMFDSL